MVAPFCSFFLSTTKFRSSRPEVFCKKGFLRNFTKFTGKHLCQRLFFNKVAGLRPEACNFIKKESLAQVFSCEFCEISKNTFFHRTPLVAASKNLSWLLSYHKETLFLRGLILKPAKQSIIKS